MTRRDNYCLVVLVYAVMAAIIGGWTVGWACGQEWQTVPPIRQSGLPGLLGELEDRMPAEHIYRDQSDAGGWAHETIHALNSRLRNAAGPGMNAAYFYGCGAVVLREPPITLAQVAAAVTKRGQLYDTYFVQMRVGWNNQPLFLLDEMSAYLAGAITDYEFQQTSGVVGRHEKAVEMYGYVCVLHDVLKSVPRERYDLRPLNAVLNQTHEYLEMLIPYAGQRVGEVRCGPGGCGPSGCGPTGQPAWKGSGLFGRLRFQRAMPKFPCHRQQVIVNTVPGPGTRPPLFLPHPGPEPPLDPPLVPIPDPISNAPSGVTQEQLDSLRDELLAAIAAIPAGRTGDTGQQGARGLPGLTGPAGQPGEPGPAGPSGEPAQAGEQGPPGSDGPRGQDGPPGAPGVVDPAILAAIQASLTGLLARIEILEERPPPSPVPAALSHMVLVRDASSEYWPRLRGELEAAKGYFSAIREADPPAFSVELPVLVGYSDGDAVWRISGLRDVGNALRLITRNQFDPTFFSKGG